MKILSNYYSGKPAIYFYLGYPNKLIYSPEQLMAEDVALIYRVRWSVELVFKELKSLYKLDVISSGAPVVVESLVAGGHVQEGYPDRLPSEHRTCINRKPIL